MKEAYQEALRLSRELVEREATVGDLSKRLAVQELQIQALQAELSDAVAAVADSRERIAHAEEGRTELATALSTLAATLAETTRQRTEIEAQLAERQGEVAGLTAELERQADALRELKNRKSIRLAEVLGPPYSAMKHDFGNAGAEAVRRVIAVGKRVLPSDLKMKLYPAYQKLRRRLTPDDRPYRRARREAAAAMAMVPSPVAPSPAPTETGRPRMWTDLRAYGLQRYRPKVSVVIPVHGQADLLSRSLDSLLKQTYDNLELIILIDGATDELDPLLANYADNPRVKVLTQEQQGLPRALTNAFQQATGEYYLWTAPGNVSLPHQVEALLSFLMINPDIDMVYSNHDDIDLPRSAQSLGLAPDNFIGASFMYSATSGRVLGEYDPTLTGTADFDYWLRMAKLFRIGRLDSNDALCECLDPTCMPDEKFGDNVGPLLQYDHERNLYYDRPFDIVFVAGGAGDAERARVKMLRWAQEFNRAGCNITWLEMGTPPPAAGELPPDAWVLRDCDIKGATAKTLRRAKRVIICDQAAAEYLHLIDELKHGSADTITVALVQEAASASAAGQFDFTLPMDAEVARALAGDCQPNFLRAGAGLPTRDLLMRARDSHYQLWDFPANTRPKMGYFGPLRRELFDIAYLRAFIEAMPEYDFVLIGTECDSDCDFKDDLQDLPNVYHLGLKPESERCRYLSRYDCMVLPLRNTEAGLRLAERLALDWVLLAGRRVAASVVPPGFRLPYLVATADPRQAAEDMRALVAHPVDGALLDRYITVHSWERQAANVLKLANNRLFYARTRGVEKEQQGLAGRPATRYQSERTRLLIEVQSLDQGDPAQLIYHLVQGIDRSAYSIIIVCTEHDGHIAHLCRKAGVPVHVLGDQKAEEYEELLRRYRIDVVNQHYSTFGGPIAAHLDIPVLAVIHHSHVGMTDGQVDSMRRADRWVDQYIAVSDDVKEYAVRQIGVPSEKVLVVPIGLPIAALEQIEAAPPTLTRAQFGLTADDYVFLYFAAADGREGQNAVISAMGGLANTRPEIKVLIAGSVPQQGLEQNIITTGPVPDAHDLFRIADGFLLPSIVEGWSAATLEAMYFGLPLLLTDGGGARQLIVENDIGIVVSDMPSNIDALAKAMLEMADNREQWRQNGLIGRQKVLDRYGMAQTARGYERIISALARCAGAENVAL